jgi:alkanesulfonate monooxygenase SsuD/methylene tetrahydromethanopterin reductase-like flavin-dependent oxidoreductase (luciferase family)
VSVRIGVTLPQFREEAEAAIAAAQRAEALGLDGVFVFDHLWPIGNPEGVVLHAYPLLGAIAAETTRVDIAPFVARVGLVPDAVLVNTLASLAHIAGRERTIAGVGTGDGLSKPENLAFGVEYESVALRVAAVRRVCRSLRERGVTTWAGGRSPELRAVAADDADALNIWGASPAEVVSEIEDLRARAGGRAVEVSWGGQVLVGRTDAEAAAKFERYGPRRHLVHGTVAEVARHFDALRETGVTYVVCAPLDVHDDPAAYETLAEVRQVLLP